MFVQLYCFVFFIQIESVNLGKIYGAQQKWPYFENLTALQSELSTEVHLRSGVILIDVHIVSLSAIQVMLIERNALIGPFTAKGR